MGNQLSQAQTQVLPLDSYIADISGHEYLRNLRTTRFLKTAQTRFGDSMNVVKVFVKPHPDMDLSAYGNELLRIQRALASNPNVLPYKFIMHSGRAAFLVRHFFFCNLYDRLSTRPFLNTIEKKWVAFQLLCALSFCHQHGVCHADVKIDNVLLTSWNWVVLTDFASFKPAFLPEDNPAAFSLFFDTSGRRTCCIAPERFYCPSQSSSEHIYLEGDLSPAMDIFSLGCLIGELFTDGKPLFDLSELLQYRKTKRLPKALEQIQEDDIRALVTHMINVDPEQRMTATEYLTEWRNKIFPDQFYRFLHSYMQQFVTGPPTTPDQKILKLDADFAEITKMLRQDALPKEANPFVIVLSLVTACVRSLKVAKAKLTALELMTKLASHIDDEYILDRILPYIMSMLSDHLPLVRASALRALTQSVSIVTSVRHNDVNLFPEYIIPHLHEFPSDDELIVRIAYAENIALLAETSLRFLEIAQLTVRADQELGLLSAYDAELFSLREMFQEEILLLICDSESIVKSTLLASNIDRLCVFLGHQKTTDVLLSHMLTFFNNKSDWSLRMAFLKSIVGVAAYVGCKTLERYILPLLDKCLVDSEEFVVEQTLTSLKALVQLGLFDRSHIRKLTEMVSPLLAHPGIWVRYGAVGFISAVARVLSTTEIHCSLLPLLQQYLKHTVVGLGDEIVLLDALEPPVPRAAFEFIVGSPDFDTIMDALMERSSLRVQRKAGNPQREIADPEKQRLLQALKKCGMTEADEDKLLSLSDYVQKISKERQWHADDLQAPNMGRGVINIRATGVRVHEVPLVEPEPRPLGKAAKGRSQTFTAGAKDAAGPRNTPPDFAMPDYSQLKARADTRPPPESQSELERLIERKKTFSRPHKIKFAAHLPHPTLKKGKDKAGKDKNAATSIADWRPEGTLVGHLQEHTAAVNSIVVAHDSKFFATASDDGSIRIWDCHKLEGKAVTNKSRMCYTKPGRFRKATFCEQSHSIAAASSDGSLYVFRVEHASKQFKPMLHKQLDLQEDGCVVDLHHREGGGSESLLCYATVRGRIHALDLRAKSEAWCLNSLPAQGLIETVLFDPSGSWMLVGTARGVHTVWDLRFQQAVKSWHDPESGGVVKLAQYPVNLLPKDTEGNPQWMQNPLVLSATGRNEIRVWDVSRSVVRQTWRAEQPRAAQPKWVPKIPEGLSQAAGGPGRQAIAPPRKPFDFFERSMMRQLRNASSNLNGEALSQQIRQKWEELPDSQKRPFRQTALHDLARYEDQTTAYLNDVPDLNHSEGELQRRGIRAMVNPPGSSIVITGGADHHLRVWDLAKPEDSYILTRARAGAGGKGSGPDPARPGVRTTYKDTRGPDGAALVQEHLGLEASHQAHDYRGPVAPSVLHQDSVLDVAFISTPSPMLVSGGREGVVKVWK